MKANLSILMLTPRHHVRGPVPKHSPHLVAGLRERGHDLTVLEWGRTQDLEQALGKVKTRFLDIVKIRRTVCSRRFDLLVVKTAHDWATLARDIPLVLATRHRVGAIVLQFHGSEPERALSCQVLPFGVATRMLLDLVEGALVLSAEEAGLWSRFYPEGRFEVVRNPLVPLDLSEAGSSQPGAATSLLFVGRVIRPKGLFELIDALPEVLQRQPATLRVVGEGEDLEAAKRKVCELGLESVVEFCGYCTGAQLVRAYQAADMLVLPTWWPEGFPTVITEALQVGLPVVTTRTRGQADVLVDGENALFVPPKDPHALAQSLIRLSQDAELRKFMAARNRELVRTFSAPAVARDYEKSLLRILAT